MLSVLKIRNIAIIESAEIDFSRGFNVLTGETGAGKSIILDSINAVLGFRTSRELIRTGESEAEVTALFTDIGETVNEKLREMGFSVSEDDSLVINRIMTADKNICRVNGAVTNVASLKELGGYLISIHGQQDNRELLNAETHLSYIDAVAENGEALSSYRDVFHELSETEKRIKVLSGSKAEKARKIDMVSFQIDELEKADIQIGEWEELKKRRTAMLNFEKIQSAAQNAYSALYGDDTFSGAVNLASAAARELSAVSQYSEEAGEFSNQLNDVYYLLNDIADSLRDGLGGEEFTPEELQNTEERLDLLYRLSKKYGNSEEEMLFFLQEAKAELAGISLSDEELASLTVKREKLEKEAKEKAKSLSDMRKKTAKVFCENVCTELQFLDMANVKFSAFFTETPLSENGTDFVEFLISANVGEEPKPITKIASGGELSRIMLAFKNVISLKDKVATMIFDEIDTGVSGHAALKVAQKLKQVSRGRQVICVTHLAQLASYGDSHYLIEKTSDEHKTYTKVTPLTKEGRKKELARIMGNGEMTELQLQNAEEMLNSANKG